MVTILEDDLVEDEEIFTIDLDTSDPAVSLGPNSTKEVLITDNDGNVLVHAPHACFVIHYVHADACPYN